MGSIWVAVERNFSQLIHNSDGMAAYIKNPAFRQENRVKIVSERQDLNLRPLQPHCSALPDCATLR